MRIESDTRFLIVGMGLLGGSYARALKKQGYRVETVTRSQKSLDFALKEGIVDRGAARPDPALIGQADVIVLAVYPHVLTDWLRENQHACKKGALITDVTGVKSCVVYEAQALLREDLEYVPAHPMAGREVLGVENSDEGLFRGANYIVTPTDRNTPQAIEACEDLGRILGFGRISRLTPEKHDEIIGFVSQLTHCIAVSLMTSCDDPHLARYTGDSFRDLTRIARINDEMWSELFLDNRPALLGQIDRFSGELARLRAMLEAGDREGLRTMMRLSTARREALNKDRARPEEERNAQT